MAASALVLRGVPVEDSSDNQYQASEGKTNGTIPQEYTKDLKGTRRERIALANITYESSPPVFSRRGMGGSEGDASRAWAGVM